ncbi:MAG: GGDEF domain-containing protein [Deltaproteobacteria bacterium]|nr:GGDEF domain-containing protein [Deltaproteobacteria bacterium]
MSWFGRKGAAPPVTPPRAATEPAAGGESKAEDALLDSALDALGGVLRTFGRYAFSLEETTAAVLGERYERWARHVLTGAPPPDATEASRLRDFRLLQRDFAERRKAEAEHVRRVRELIWIVMNGVRGALAHDAAADARLSEPLDRLRRVVASEAPMAEVRTEVGAAIAAIEETLATRQRDQARDLQTMGGKLRGARSDLLAGSVEGELCSLTRVFTRGPFDRHLENASSLADLTGEVVTVLVVDADQFKSVNECIGREAGDRTLRALADAVVRVASRSTDHVARIEDDAFGIVLGDTGLADALKVAERVREAVRRISVQGLDGGVSVSIGVAERQRFEASTAWLGRALAALVAAKGQGRDCLVVSQGT